MYREREGSCWNWFWINFILVDDPPNSGAAWVLVLVIWWPMDSAQCYASEYWCDHQWHCLGLLYQQIDLREWRPMCAQPWLPKLKKASVLNTGSWLWKVDLLSGWVDSGRHFMTKVPSGFSAEASAKSSSIPSRRNSSCPRATPFTVSPPRALVTTKRKNLKPRKTPTWAPKIRHSGPAKQTWTNMNPTKKPLASPRFSSASMVEGNGVKPGTDFQIRTSHMLQGALIPKNNPALHLDFGVKILIEIDLIAPRPKNPIPPFPACAQPTQSFQGDWRPSTTVANPFDAIP